MTTEAGKQWWDPYETSNQRQFVFRPNSAAQTLLCPTSTSFIDSYSHSGPFGSTVYNKDFCWKPVCKPECIRTGTASGQRRNNPHPSQSFMMWRLPRKAAQSSDSAGYNFKCSPSEEKIREALTAQYRSIYRCDFMSVPQGYDNHHNAERKRTPKQSRHKAAPTIVTEMRDNYRQPEQKPELLHYHYSTHSNVARRGIVPAVMPRHIHTHQKRSDVTNCDRIYGKRVTCEGKSFFPEEGKEAARTELGKDAYPDIRKTVTKPPAVINPCSPEWISSWPGPL